MTLQFEESFRYTRKHNHQSKWRMSQNRGVIAAGHRKTAEAGQEMFALGGNAFDAAIASLFAAFVVEPTLTSAGGSGFLLAYPHNDRPLLFDFFSQTPLTKRPQPELDFYAVELNFGGEVQTFQIGMGSIAVPGNLAGAVAVQQKLGKLPFQEVVQPAIEYARNGFEITSYQAFCLRLLEPILLAQPESRKIFAPQGKLLAAGEICTMKNFADTLTFLAQNGVEEFYRGEIARQLVKDSQVGGGYLTLADLSNYQVIVRAPLRSHYRGYELLTNPPPSAGGTLIALALKLLSAIDLGAIEFGSSQHLQILAQVMRLTNEARRDYDAHPEREETAEGFLAGASKYQQPLQNLVNKWGSTTHISVIDSEGNAASTTTTNGEGSAYMIPGTGIMLNNMLGEADINPCGFHNWLCDRRIASMMAPTILLEQGTPQIVLGSGGSNRIRTALLQVISNLVDFNLPLDEAVQSPRVHWENNVFSIEPPVNQAIESCKFNDSQVVLWSEKNMFFGGVHGVQMTNQGLEGAGDSRRDGIAIFC